MPVPKPEGDAAPAYMALQSLPVPIPWIPDAFAVYDLVRCTDLRGANYREMAAPHEAEQARIAALMDALPKDAPISALRALEAELEASTTAQTLELLAYTRCQVHGINPTPVPDKPETWRHLHPALRNWLAHQGWIAAAEQLQSPLAQLRSLR